MSIELVSELEVKNRYMKVEDGLVSMACYIVNNNDTVIDQAPLRFFVTDEEEKESFDFYDDAMLIPPHSSIPFYIEFRPDCNTESLESGLVEIDEHQALGIYADNIENAMIHDFTLDRDERIHIKYDNKNECRYLYLVNGIYYDEHNEFMGGCNLVKALRPGLNDLVLPNFTTYEGKVTRIDVSIRLIGDKDNFYALSLDSKLK